MNNRNNLNIRNTKTQARMGYTERKKLNRGDKVGNYENGAARLPHNKRRSYTPPLCSMSCFSKQPQRKK